MEKIKYTILALALSLLGLSSCSKDEAQAGDGQAIAEPAFTLDTRADSEVDPDHGDAFTMMAYNMGAETQLQQNQVLNITGGLPYGYYAYDKDGNYGAAGGLIPATVSETEYKATTTPFTKNRSNAMKLQSYTSETGQRGVYRIAMLYPAVPVRITGELGLLAMFDLKDDLWASSPDDVNGDGTLDDPFEIINRTNQDVYAIPTETRLYPVQAAIRAYFYSTQNYAFNIESIDLVNAGINGWYNARTGLVYPNYNYKNKKAYAADLEVENAGDNYLNIKDKIVASTASVPLEEGGSAQASWMLDDQRVFPSDYRGAEKGGTSYVVPMTLSVSLRLTATNTVNNASIPIALEIKRNKRYIFYIDVQSDLIRINYSIGDWDNANDDNSNIGGDINTYLSIPFTAAPGGWGDGGDGNQDIGS